ncbi:MAG: ABC transporter ATP-binding protein [Alloprevotella sp.]|nr:ABC transporter ATP-binding protein [Alloprevotella sp.]
MIPPALSFEALVTGYGSGRRRRIVGSGLTASLAAGDFVALIGRNGCGKSTLLRTVAGFQKPLAGSLSLQGRAVQDYGTKELARSLAVVLTARPDTGYLTVREAVATGRTPYTGLTGRLSEGDKDIIAEALRLTATDRFADRPLASLSDGERQRVMVAKALAQQTPLILLDEPTAFLDHPAKRDLLALLRTLAKERGKTVLLSTHDLELTARYADRAWLLTPGGITEQAAFRI